MTRRVNIKEKDKRGSEKLLRGVVKSHRCGQLYLAAYADKIMSSEVYYFEGRFVIGGFG